MHYPWRHQAQYYQEMLPVPWAAQGGSQRAIPPCWGRCWEDKPLRSPGLTFTTCCYSQILLCMLRSLAHTWMLGGVFHPPQQLQTFTHPVWGSWRAQGPAAAPLPWIYSLNLANLLLLTAPRACAPVQTSELHPSIWAHISPQPRTGCDTFSEHTRQMDRVITPTKPKKGKIRKLGIIFFPLPL